jgi:hypothetical protein
MILCSWCGTDEYVTFDSRSKVALCDGPGHPFERMWEPSQQRDPRSALSSLPDGIAVDLGLYDSLPKCLSVGEWAETGVVEHRFGTDHPEEYRWMVNRWGHVCQGPRRYSVTSFIGSTLGALSRATNVTGKFGRGSGFFDYNTSIGMWTLEPVPPSTEEMTWAKQAVEIGCSPRDWPLLGYAAPPASGETLL